MMRSEMNQATNLQHSQALQGAKDGGNSFRTSRESQPPDAVAKERQIFVSKLRAGLKFSNLRVALTMARWRLTSQFFAQYYHVNLLVECKQNLRGARGAMSPRSNLSTNSMSHQHAEQNGKCGHENGARRRIAAIVASLLYTWLEQRCGEWNADEMQRELIEGFDSFANEPSSEKDAVPVGKSKKKKKKGGNKPSNNQIPGQLNNSAALEEEKVACNPAVISDQMSSMEQSSVEDPARNDTGTLTDGKAPILGNEDESFISVTPKKAKVTSKSKHTKTSLPSKDGSQSNTNMDMQVPGNRASLTTCFSTAMSGTETNEETYFGQEREKDIRNVDFVAAEKENFSTDKGTQQKHNTNVQHKKMASISKAKDNAVAQDNGNESKTSGAERKITNYESSGHAKSFEQAAVRSPDTPVVKSTSSAYGFDSANASVFLIHRMAISSRASCKNLPSHLSAKTVYL
jgi:hypothetical protein